MQPELFQIPIPGIGTIPIRSFGLLLLIGFAAALVIARRRFEVEGRSGGFFVDLGTLALLSGIAGARAFYLWQYREEFNWGLLRLWDARYEPAGLLLGAAGGIALLALLRGTPLARPKALLSPARLAAGAGLLGAVLGARALYAVRHPEEAGESPFGFLRIDQGGLVLYGGFLLAIPSGLLFLRRRGLAVGPVADALAPALGLGLAFGRIGCLLNGCCAGKPTRLPWALTFPPGSPAHVDQVRLGLIAPDASAPLPVHPTQPLSSLLDYALFLALLHIPLPGARPGARFALFLALYGVLRFGIEILRENPPYVGSLSVPQWISSGLVLGSGALFLRLRRPAPAP